MEKIKNICYAIGKALMVSGPFNMQLIAKVRLGIVLFCVDCGFWIEFTFEGFIIVADMYFLPAKQRKLICLKLSVNLNILL